MVSIKINEDTMVQFSQSKYGNYYCVYPDGSKHWITGGNGTFENPRIMTHDNLATGDFVRCNNCSEYMIVNLGVDICPCCGCDGGLSWADPNNENNHEVGY
jgi:hypothetical protein